MRQRIAILMGALGASTVFTVCAATATDSTIVGRLVVEDAYDQAVSCTTATGDGDACIDDALECNGALDVGGATTMTGDLTLNGGAGCLNTSGSGDSTLVAKDADSTAFCMGAAGALDLVCLDTTDASPALDVKGVVGQIALHVDAGTVKVDEDVAIGGGAGAINTSASGDSTLVVTDADSTAFCAGATGALDLVCLDTTDASPALDIKGVASQVALHVDQGTVLFDEDVSIGGGTGALSLTHSDSSILLNDNDASALDIGAAGETDMVRFATTNGAETVEFRVGTALTGIYETFGEGASKGLSTLEIDGTATTGTAGGVHHAYVGGGNIFGFVAIGDNQAADVSMTADGLNIAGDQADNEGREIFTGYASASGRPMVVGTDPAFYFLTSIKVGDVSGTDTVFCGLKKLEAHNADVFAYDTYFGLGWNTSASPAALKVIEELNGAAGAQTDTTETLADATVLQIKVLIDASGNATVQEDSQTPGTLAAPTQTSAFQFDDGDLLVPICTYLEHNAGGLADSFSVGQWVVGYQ